MNKMKQIASLFVLTLIVLINVPNNVLGLGQSADLQLEGGKINGLAQKNGLVFAATRGPKGIYISSDFGDNWNFGAGGQYSLGNGKAVVTTSSAVIANLGRKIFWAPLTSIDSNSNDFSPDWQVVELGLDVGGAVFDKPEIPQSIAVDDNFLFVATNFGNVKVVTLSNMTLLSTNTITPLSSPTPLPQLAVDQDNGNIFVQLGASDRRGGKIVRASYDTSSGSIGSWSDRTPGEISAGSGCGLELAGGQGSAANNGRFGGIFTPGNGIVYISTFNGPAAERGIYRSTDNGTCWKRVVTSGERNNSLNIRSAAFSGNTHIIGRFVSLNGGDSNASVSFSEIPNDAVPLSAGLDSSAILLDPTSSHCGATAGKICAMASSAFGAIVTKDIEAGSSSTWSEKLSGMRGLLVSDIALSSQDSNKAVFGLPGGIARTSNFSLSSSKITSKAVTFDRFVPFDGAVALPEPVFSVAIDKLDDDIVYVGNNRLLRAVFDANGQPTWTVINANISPGMVVRDIVVTETRIYAVFSQVTGALGGQLRVFNRETLAPILTDGLLGKPITSLAVASQKSKDVIYLGVGGVKTDESGNTDSGNLGLYRSADGGKTFTKIEKDSFISSATIQTMAYDSRSDIMYVAANSGALPDEYESGTDDSEGSEDSPSGKLYIVTDATSSKFKLSLPTKGFPSGSPVTAVILAEKDKNSKLFAAVDNKLYQSNSKGATWALLYEGITDQSIRSLVFDDLVTSSTSGLESVSGNPNLIVSSVTSSVKAGSKSKIKITFSKEYQSSSSNTRKIKVRASGLKSKTSKRNEYALSVSPSSGTWSSSLKTIKVTVNSGFTAKDGEQLDSNYDEVIDGKKVTFKVKVK